MSNEQKLRDYLKRVTTDLHEVRQRLRAAESREQEPIAVVAMGCRFPGGVRSPEDLWRLVTEERDGVGGFPDNRGWDLASLFHPDPANPGTSYATEGGFLREADLFDPGLFGISPREATAMDPQQRLLLETSWEVFERAGIDVTSLRGSRTGVFTGVMYHDYAARLRTIPEGMEGYLGNGSAGSIASGRIAYTFGLEGPALTIDTACSSSLVALHLACQSLRRGESSLALAGGVTVMSTPGAFVEFSRLRGLAPDGRCKSFSAAADGTGWSEGVGLVLLERLSDAVANGHPVLAVVRGSAVNQDGASNGLTAPNGPSQERVILQALTAAGLSTDQVDAVDAHGTGTPLGDPIEAQALLATYGKDRSQPLLLGSLKSNIGHTQAAAGVGAVIKMVQAMRHGVLPRILHLDEPTSHVDWSAGAVSLLTSTVPWPESRDRRRAGVSAFGISGTNAHVILEEAPEPVEQPRAEGSGPWVLTAKTAEALNARAAQIAELEAHPLDIAHSLATTRAALDHRAVLLDPAALPALLAGEPDPNVVRGVSTGGKTVFVFPGQGSQWTGMARDLLDNEVFASSMSLCAKALAPHVDWDLFEELDGPLERVDVVQPVLWAVMVSLAELWRSHGVEPEAVIGHSQGEIAAACVAGALSVEDAAKVVALRSRELLALSGRGGMVSVATADVDDLLTDGVEVAAVNGAASVVLSGDTDALDKVMERCADKEIRARRIPVDYASHSRHVEDIEDRLREVLAGVEPRRPDIPFLSTVTGEWLTETLDADYWYRNLRQPVLFAPAVRTALDLGYSVIIEVSPHPVLAVGVQESIDRPAAVVGTLRRDEDGQRRFRTALAEAYVHGAHVDWAKLCGGGRRIDLPTYPFQHERFWLDAPATTGEANSFGLAAADHPLLGAVVRMAERDSVLLTGRLSLHTHPWLAEHRVGGVALLPGAAFVDLAVRAGDEAGCGRIDELTLEAPLIVPEQGGVHVHLSLEAPDEDGRRAVAVHSRPEDSEDWTRNAVGVLSPRSAEPSTVDSRPAEAEPVDVTGFYDRLAEAGLGYSGPFQGLRSAWRLGDDVYAEVAIDVDAAGFGLHPALLDAALHTAALGTATEVKLPFAWTGVELHAVGATALRVRMSPAGPDAISLELSDMDGHPVATVESLVLRAVAAPAPEPLYRVEWVPVAKPDSSAETGLYEVTADDPLTATTEALDAIRSWDESRPLTVLTSGATTGENLAAAAVWGLVRSAQSENPDRFVLVDSDGSVPPGVAVASGATQVLVREGELFAPRLARPSAALIPPRARAWRLEVTTKGSLDNVALVECPDALRPLEPGQVRLGLRAAGLNFRDVLLTLGMVDQDGLGGEAAGIVLEAAPDTGFVPGERVFGMFPDSIGPVAIADHRMIARMPEGMTFEQAETIPVVFLTAYYGLVDLGGLRAGESVLVHAAAGGVGMAAVQLARHLGAEVYGTASPAKWAATGLPADRVANSRDLGFAERFPKVDVVLNSLAREFVDASLGLLGPGGRFLEMGKTDRRDAAQVAEAHPGVTYRIYDIMEAGPARIGEMLGELMELFRRGALTPLPVTAWDVRRAVDALRHLGQAKHVGKVVLRIPPVPDPDGAVLITGASGTLGGLIARHLVAEHGVRKLVLLSRSGAAAPELDADVTVVACDAADRDALATVFSAHDITSVVHAAGVLDDGLVHDMTPEKVEKVLRPKVDAAINLHELAGDLASFILFSSVAGTLGAAGQSNYAAANAVLDALALRRHAEGLPAQSLAWGFWAQRSGMTAHLDDADVQRMERAGMPALSTEEGLALFDAAVASPEPVLLPLRLDRAALRKLPELPELLRSVVRAPARRVVGASTQEGSALVRRLAGLPSAEREARLLDLVRAEVAAVLGHSSPESISPDRAFGEIGFDSLTAVELRNRLAAATGLRLPTTLVFDHPNPAAVTRHLLTELLGTTAAESVRGTASDEPLAIVGISCRFPGGVASPDDLWRLVAEGTDALSGFPVDRGWDTAGLHDPDPDRPGTSYVSEGGFLTGASEFDAEFFGISPREALAMDPQQRLLLEASWEAFEHAGIAPDSLRGSHTGVFAGVSGQEYAALVHQAAASTEGYLLTGTSASVISGRVAYAFGLEGPAVTVDTACSSSLVALHLAGGALRNGECSMALVGGVALMATPGAFVEFSRQRGLAEDGRCKPFAAAADGTGWGEGVGVLVVERLSDAQRNGRRILAVVRGSAVNSDGASNGLTAPNGPSQQRVIRAALDSAGLAPSDVDVVEAHGTGTRLGDPIEAQAVIAAYGQDRPRPLWLGSLKSNIGHAQAAAGVGGVIKMVQALRHRVLPKTLHVDSPTPHVDWSAGAVALLTENVEWSSDRPRRAGVSSFGVSGTNAHVILEEAPQDAAAPARDEPSEPDAQGFVPWVLSAKTPEALEAQVDRLRAAAADHNPVDVACSLLSGRASLPHRAVVLGDRVITGTGSGRPVFVFPGQGSQWTGMARDLLGNEVFASSMSACASALAPHADWDLFEELDGPLDRVDVVQPVLWAVMVSLAAVWRSYGVEPAAVVGHSQGEIAAACVAGALSLEDAAKVVALRSKELTALSGLGGMVSVSTGDVSDLLTEGIGVAAVNGPGSVVISGDAAALDVLMETCEERGIRARRIPVDYASHSRHVERIHDRLAEVLSGITPKQPEIPFFSTVTGDWIDEPVDAGYWYRNLRKTVLFGQSIQELLKDHGLFIEISPHPVLLMGMSEADAVAIGSLRRDDGGTERFLTSLAEAYVHGADVDWFQLCEGGRFVELPTYAFQRTRYWLDTPTSTGDLSSVGLNAPDHPLLGAAVPLAEGDGYLLTGRLSRRAHPWLADHQVLGTVLLPGTAFLELAIRAGDEVGCGRVEELTLHAPLVLPERDGVQLQVTVGGAELDGSRAVAVHSRLDDGQWTCNATGLLGTATTTPEGIAVWPPAGAVPVELDGFYPALAEAGFGYGPRFQGLTAAWRVGEEIAAEVRVPADEPFGLHPALLDSALHAIGLSTTDSSVRLPFAWGGVALHAAGASVLRVRLRRVNDDELSLIATDETGQPVLTVESLALRSVTAAQIRAAGRSDSLFQLDWKPVPVPAPSTEDYDVVEVSTVFEALEAVQRADNRVVIHTNGDIAGVPDPAVAAVWGLVRSAQSENPDRFVLFDGPAELLAAAVALGEPQVAVHDGGLVVPRLARAGNDGLVEPEEPWRLEVTETGTLDALALEPHPVRALGEGEVRIAVRATGVNFRDVVLSLGMVPDQEILGSEGAGVVVETGPGVTGLRPGDRVMGLFTGAFAALAVADQRTLAKIPAGWSFTQAASVPVAFLTAYYGLVDLGGLRRGQSVLIHSAAGGVGMAAVQIAKHLGAEVFGTSSPAKWHATGLDADHVASSRDLGFAERFPKVDVVLNSLAGEFVDASLGLLKPGGRFVEMGKTDLRDGIEGYRAFDLVEAGPNRLGELLAEVLRLSERGVLTPLPVRAWDVRRAPEAFRFLSQAKHIGKVVLTAPARIGPEGTVLITGGTGTLGGLLARHLVREHGVRNLLLLSRRGSAPELEADLRELGADVTIAACDAADRDALATVLSGHSVTTVIHAAGVLDDGVVQSLTPERLEAVMRPKVDAAVNLRELTGDLDAFVLFSSAAATFGGPGQANYAAANAYLDAFAQRSRAEGGPAQSLAWGLWAERSEMTGHLGEADRKRMSSVGVARMSTEEGLALFDAAVRSDRPVLLPMRLEPALLRADAAMLPPLLHGLVRAGRRAAATRGDGGSSLLATLSGLSAGEQESILMDLVREGVAAVLGHSSPESVRAGTAFKEIGFDSLTAVELRNRLTAATGVRLPVTLVFDHPTPAAVAAHLLAELAPETADAAPEPGTSEDEVRAALAAIPLSRLRDAGVLDTLLEIAGLTGPGEDDASLDELDADSLVALAFQQATS
ncbi:SDR family NAD(P)-dependent oxidoreductase [Allokutzneria sp. A3M-2-11 16]|uniref:type I polyketide synthase n=1 Tax=Allokutzneria sp. A3M-2-11 16 TaxID=2962043 RepID=UPI0020B8EBC7|nr:type I polyketide synthase [Allokutzneria sp. A3M-2-11 16]MCP3803258.1 SDR family NAD(P)-dependent oxidoreductase [Allokutzneria sp. A3M-2-11 16]